MPVNLKDEQQLQAEMYKALRKNDLDLFQFLIDNVRKENQGSFLSTSLSPDKPTLLQYACDLQITKAVEILINANVDPNQISNKIFTPPLIMAVEKGNVAILQVLTSHPTIELNVMDAPKSHRTALHRVIAYMGDRDCRAEKKSRYRQCFDYLLDTSINVNSRNLFANTPLHEAAYWGLEEAVIKLLKNGADPNLKGKERQTVLHIFIDRALRNNSKNTEKMNRIVKCIQDLVAWSHYSTRVLSSIPIDINAEDLHHRTPLHFAVSCGSKEVVSLLLQNGSNPNIKDDIGKTPLHELVSSVNFSIDQEDKERFLECLDVLLEYQALDLESKCSFGFTALNYAISSGVGETVSRLLKRGADPNTRDENGQTPLHHVLWELSQSHSNEELKGYGECLDALLKDNTSLPATVNSQDHRGDTALHLAIRLGEQVNSQDNDGNTALHLSIRYGLEEAMSKLRSIEQVDMQIKNKQGWTVIHQVVHPKALESSKSLKKNRAKYFDILMKKTPNGKLPIDVNTPDEHGKTLLHYAIVSRFEEGVVKLLQFGAQMDSQTCKLILPSTWEAFMDSCISAQNEDEEISSTNFPVTFDYSRLSAPCNISLLANRRIIQQSSQNTSSRGPSEYPPYAIVLEPIPRVDVQGNNMNNQEAAANYPECEILLHLSRSPSHHHLMKHPLVTSFLLQKWHRVRWFYYISLLIYAVYLAVSSAYFLEQFRIIENKNMGWIISNSEIHSWTSVRECLFVVCLIYFGWALIQFSIAPFLFLLRKENWVHLTVLGLTCYLTGSSGGEKDHLFSVAVFLGWTEGLILLSRHPKLSMYVTMFTTVSLAFLRLLLWYSVLLLGFALSFLFLFRLPENLTKPSSSPSFKSVYDNFLRVLVMMTGEFNLTELSFTNHIVISRIIFLAFLFLISIVLFSLLNAVAVSDIRDIRNKAETIYYTNLVETIAIRESLFLGDPCNILPGWTLIKFCWRPNFNTNSNCLRRFVLPHLLLFSSNTNNDDVLIEAPAQNDGTHRWCNPFQGIVWIWKTYFSNANYQLDKEILQSARQKVLENRQKTNAASRNNNVLAEIDTLRDDIQDILKRLNPSCKMISPEYAKNQTYEERRKTLLNCNRGDVKHYAEYYATFN